MMSALDLRVFSEIDARIVEIVRGVRVLSQLSWPNETQRVFLDGWRRGAPELPRIAYQANPQTERVNALRTVQKEVPADHPLGHYLLQTIQSYIAICRLLENVGSPRMTPFSVELYGKPGDSLAGGRVHNIDAARHFLTVAEQFNQNYALSERDYCLPPSVLQQEMKRRIDEIFDHHRVRVVVDPDLVSKAAAGATRIRLRDGTCFSEYDLEQLLQHEAFVHSLTAINGREQAHFKSLGLGAPRTTAAQEGLATFSELITGVIDITRLERIALRIIAIDMALAGADFIEVFRCFVESGQPESESFNSAMRVFRGAPLTGGSAFTKDTVYLHGLMEVHTFFRWCLQHQKLELCRMLFAGRMTVGDVVRLAEFFDCGYLSPPMYLPPWMRRPDALSAYLAFSVFANHIRIQELGEGFSFDSISEIGI